MELEPPDPTVAARMRSQRRANTTPEIRVRQQLFSSGLRYRVGIKVPGNNRRTIDIAFPRQRVAVFIDGCFWHRCPLHSTPAKNNAEWWEEKLAKNVDRDRSTTALLEDQGWLVLRFWEHEEPHHVTEKIVKALSKRG